MISRVTWFWVLSIVGLAAPWIISAIRHYEPESYQCRVASVSDGDTLRVNCGGEKKKIRLHCIDAPEMKRRPWGRESRDHLRSLATGGRDLQEVGDLLGHASITMTERYAHLSPDNVRAAVSILDNVLPMNGAAQSHSSPIRKLGR